MQTSARTTTAWNPTQVWITCLRRFYYAAQLNFLTQFTDGYDYLTSDVIPISTIMARLPDRCIGYGLETQR